MNASQARSPSLFLTFPGAKILGFQFSEARNENPDECSSSSNGDHIVEDSRMVILCHLLFAPVPDFDPFIRFGALKDQRLLFAIHFFMLFLIN
jgi:hypothetical protein